MGVQTLARGGRLVSAKVEREGDRDRDTEQLLEGLLADAYTDEGPADPQAAERALLQGMSPGRPAGDVLLSELGQRLEFWRRLGADIEDPRLRRHIEDGAMPIGGGMPTGATGLAFVHNLPPAGTFSENTDTFFRTTERNDIPQSPVAYPGLGGGPVDMRIPNIGVISAIRAVLNLTLVVGGTGAVTANYPWPWDTVKRAALNINGQTAILGCEGKDLRARRQRYFRNPREQVSTAPATDAFANPAPGVIANGTYAVVLVYDLPIAHDDYNLAGSVYAQSDQNSLTWRIEAAAQSDMFSVAAGGTVALTGTIYWTITLFDIPFADTQQGRQVLLPDMSWIHGILAFNQPYANTGEVQIGLIRTAGQLLCTYVYLDNGGAVQIDPGALTEIRFQYGGNRRPRTYNPPLVLLEKNDHDYNGRLQPGYFVLDNEVDNPVRDLVVPKGVTELYVVVTIPQGVTLNPNARAHTVEETMFKGR